MSSISRPMVRITRRTVKPLKRPVTGAMSNCRFNDKMALNLHWTVNMFSFYTRLLAVALLLAQLSACGLKGDLYIPERQYPQTPQQDKSSS